MAWCKEWDTPAGFESTDSGVMECQGQSYRGEGVRPLKQVFRPHVSMVASPSATGERAVGHSGELIKMRSMEI